MQNLLEFSYFGLMALFGLAMVAFVWFKTHQEKHAEGFLVADRKIPFWGGMLTIAITWCWADLFFVTSQQAYLDGFSAIFWISLPCFLSFPLYGIFAQRARNLMPQGYSLPNFINKRFNSNAAAHTSYTVVTLLFQVCVLAINATVAGVLFEAVSGVPALLSMVAMTLIVLSYSLLSGLKASVYTDIIQTLIMGFGLLVILPWALLQSGEPFSLAGHFQGLEGNRTGILDLDVIWNFAILYIITQITLPFVDQMFFQRAMAVKDKTKIVPIFFGAGVFATLFVVGFCLFGILGVSLVNTGVIQAVEDPQMIIIAAIGTLLPDLALYLITIMFLACVFSTSDSSFCASASLGSVDIYKRYFAPDSEDKQILKAARISMLVVAFVAIALALFDFQILWLLFIAGNVAAAAFVPTLFSFYSTKVSGNFIAAAVLLSLITSTPIMFYANLVERIDLMIFASCLSLVIGLLVCTLNILVKPDKSFQFDDLQA